MPNIYLDNNATTALDPRVLDAMLVDLQAGPANPSSVHRFGREARNLLTKAHRRVAEAFDVGSQEVIFTSGGTEAINLVLRGLLAGGEHVITSVVEHTCVHATLEQLKCQVTALAPGHHGAVSAEQVAAAIQPNTRLIVLMAVNNETGVMTDLEGVAAVAEQAGIPFIVDGVAWLGKGAVTLPAGVSGVAFSGHKFHGPKGAGLLIARRALKLTPMITGGAQQYGRRGGTENLAGILGFAEAIALIELQHFEQMRQLRDRLEQGILQLYPAAQINGEGPRISNTSNIAFMGVDGEGLLMKLDLAGIAVSHGSACSSGSLEPSHVLLGMGYDRDRARSSLRFSLSPLESKTRSRIFFRVKRLSWRFRVLARRETCV